MNAEGRLLLYGVFRTLIEYNVPLGVTDYLDAVRALRFQLADSRRGPSREELRRLCQILWARGSEEVRLIDEIFKSIPFPSQDEVDRLAPLMQALAHPTPTDQRSTGPRESPGPIQTETGPDVDAPSINIEIQSFGAANGVPLPAALVPPRGPETFVMKPHTVVSARALAVLWRRYRRMVRVGFRTELDVEATIADQCRRGTLDRPILRAPRVNRARLLVLADVSPSMIAWRPFLDALAESLALSRLPDAEMFYFSNLPKRSLFRSPALTGATPAHKVFDRHKGAGLLVVSDAGAARGYLNRQRIAQTKTFVEAANRRARAVVWINPMPRARWKATTAGALASEKAATFLPLDVPSLIRGLDILRGAKSR